MVDIRQVVEAILLFINGMWELFSSSRDGLEFEEGVHRLWQDVGCRLYVWSLERLDNKLMQGRDRDRWKVVGFRPRTLVTSFGEVTFRRRLYREAGGDERYAFLLDRAMGWSRSSRLSCRMKQMGVVLSTDMSFRQAAKAMEFLAPGVTSMSVWKAAQEAGKLARCEAEVRRDQMFSAGEYDPGERVTDALYLEADGVHIKRQRRDEEGARSMELKMATMYEGKEQLASGKTRLRGRQTVAGFMSGPDLWERASERASRQWDLSQVEEIHVGGDGASWIKQGAEMFPGARFHLDTFHLRRALTRALSFEGEHYQAVAKAVSELDWEGVEKGLEKALAAARGARRKKKIRKLDNYLRNNWEGIGRLPEGCRMGVIEAQVRHVITRRMKHISGGWNPGGADHMAHLLAADANDELKRYVPGRAMDRETLDGVLDPEPVQQTAGTRRVSEEDVEQWLRVNMPALTGPHAGRPWVKHVLREISKAAAQWGAA